jgi:D-serine deaminase-like pyridoxal phosphate-dependent protein
MDPRYRVADLSSVPSPALLFFADLIRHNLRTAIDMAGGPGRLRPHVKTHKTREIVRLCLDAGITKHKCATVAEAEMLASCGAPDVLLAYNPVGPNCMRVARLARAYPKTRFAVTADHPAPVRALADAVLTEGVTLDVLLDVDVGQHRTGIAPGPEAVALYALIAETRNLKPGGLHVYDGHTHQENAAERRAAVLRQLEPVLTLRKTLEATGLPVPRVVAGGTPTFPVYITLDLPGLELSPGTCLLHDHGYGSRFTDMPDFVPAALLLTRVVSRPTPTRVTLDLGYKAVASDPPAGKRLILPDVPNCEQVLQNEEHLVIETPDAARFQPGDELLAIPVHICPTCAMHRQAVVIDNGRVVGAWDIVARDRTLTL